MNLENHGNLTWKIYGHHIFYFSIHYYMETIVISHGKWMEHGPFRRIEKGLFFNGYGPVWSNCHRVNQDLHRISQDPVLWWCSISMAMKICFLPSSLFETTQSKYCIDIFSHVWWWSQCFFLWFWNWLDAVDTCCKGSGDSRHVRRIRPWMSLSKIWFTTDIVT